MLPGVQLMQAADAVAKRDEADQYLDDYMTTTLADTASRLRADADLSEQIDAMAERLNEDLVKDPALLRSMSHVLRMQEVTQSDASANVRRKRSLADLLGDKSAGKFNAHVVHAQHHVDPEKILALAKNEFVRLSSFAQHDCLQAAAELNAADSSAPGDDNNQSREGLVRRSAKALARVVLAIANYGLSLFDYAYASPEFLARVPIVGTQLRHLRDQGEPLYRAIELVRHTSNYLKLMHARTRRPGLNNGEDETQLVSMSEADRQKKMRELEKLISDAGINTVKLIARRLLQHSLEHLRAEDDETHAKETSARVFYLLVANVLAQQKQKEK